MRPRISRYLSFISIVLFGATMAFRSLPTEDVNGQVRSSEGTGVEVLHADQRGGLTGVIGGAVSIADLTGDDRPDLLIAGDAGERRSRPSTTLYRNDGEDAFTEVDSNLPDVAASATAHGDVNSDGTLDLLIAGETVRDRIAALYLGDESGGFTTAGTELDGVRNGSATFGDVNGDEELDLLLTGQSLSGATDTPVARLYLGGGDGGFTRARAGLQGAANSASALGDVNRDGNLDLLIAGTDTDGVPRTTLYLGNGFGDFDKAGADLAGLAHGSAALHDFNRDGVLDVLITGRNAEEEPSTRLYRGNGDGSFTETTVDLPDVGDGAVSIGDVDADDHDDLLITGEKAGGTPIAVLYLGGEDGTFSETRAELEGVSESASAMADVDGDRHLDLLVAGEGERGEPTATLYLGEGDGDFTKVSVE